MKLPLKMALILLLSAVCLAMAGLLVVEAINAPTKMVENEETMVTIRDGEYVGAIAERLQSAGIIRSSFFLKIVSRLKGTQGDFQRGTYRIPHEATSMQIHDVLVSGSEVLTKVVIPEGWTAGRIADRLDWQGIVPKEEFLEVVNSPESIEAIDVPAESLEGYLFPDTYLFPKDFPAKRVVEEMIGNFVRTVKKIAPDMDEKTHEELHRIITVASIVEREFRAPDEAARMASVFYNRLESDMKLQSCATVAYVMTEKLGLEHPDVLTYDDLDIASPYNTYYTAGLPPGPIANPGETALRAALYPEESEFYYFVLKDPEAGRHEFSRNFNEHVSAKNLYLKKS